MRTAQGALVLDTSRFDAPLASSTAKLTAFASNLGKVAGTARSAFSSTAQLAQEFLSIRQAISTASNDIINYRQKLDKLSQVYSKLKEAGNALLTGFKALPDGLAKSTAAAVALGAGAFVAYRSLKALGQATGEVAGKIKSQLQSSLSNAGSSLSAMASKAKYGLLALVAGVTALGGATIGGVKGVFDMGDNLKTLRDRTGASIPFLMTLQKVFQRAGMSAEAVAPMLSNMQRSLTGINADGEPTNKMFARLKLNVDDLLQLNPDQQFREIQKAISGLANPAERTAAAFAIFGRSGAALTGVFADSGSMDEVSKKLEGRAKVLKENADIFAAISVKLRESGTALTGFFTAIAGKVGRPILAILEKLEGADKLTSIGEKIGSGIQTALTALYNAIEAGQLLDVLKKVIQELFAYVVTAIPTVANIIGGALLNAFQPVINFLISGLELAFENIQEKVGKTFIGKAIGLGGTKARTFEEIQAGRKQLGGKDILTNSLDDLSKQNERLTSAMKELIAPFLKETPNFAVPSTMGITPEGREGLLPPMSTQKLGQKVEGEASSLRKVGGGGGAFFADPLLKESQNQTNLLRSIDKKMGGSQAFGSEVKAVRFT
jgi:hypothetical protein